MQLKKCGGICGYPIKDKKYSLGDYLVNQMEVHNSIGNFLEDFKE